MRSCEKAWAVSTNHFWLLASSHGLDYGISNTGHCWQSSLGFTFTSGLDDFVVSDWVLVEIPWSFSPNNFFFRSSENDFFCSQISFHVFWEPWHDLPVTWSGCLMVLFTVWKLVIDFFWLPGYTLSAAMGYPVSLTAQDDSAQWCLSMHDGYLVKLCSAVNQWRRKCSFVGEETEKDLILLSLREEGLLISSILHGGLSSLITGDRTAESSNAKAGLKLRNNLLTHVSKFFGNAQVSVTTS